MSMEEADASRGAPEGETVAPPVDTSAPGTEETANTEQPAEQPGEADPKTGEPKRRPWFMDRIDRQGQRIAEQQRQIEELRAQRPNGGERQQDQRPQGDDVDTRVNAALAQREFQERVNRFDGEGRKEFPDFVDRCNTVANCGANDRPEFMQIISQMDDGHKIVAHLADHPEEAVRILGMAPARMALELGRMSAQGVSEKPPPKSAAPPPLNPISGAGRVETDPEKMSIDEWMKWRDKQS